MFLFAEFIVLYIGNTEQNWVWDMPVIPVFERWKQKEQEFKACLTTM